MAKCRSVVAMVLLVCCVAVLAPGRVARAAEVTSATLRLYCQYSQGTGSSTNTYYISTTPQVTGTQQMLRSIWTGSYYDARWIDCPGFPVRYGTLTDPGHMVGTVSATNAGVTQDFDVTAYVQAHGTCTYYVATHNPHADVTFDASLQISYAGGSGTTYAPVRAATFGGGWSLSRGCAGQSGEVTLDPDAGFVVLLVKDAMTDDIIIHARIEMDAAPYDFLGDTYQMSNPDGKVHAYGIRAGAPWSLTVTKDGYAPYHHTGNVPVSAGETATFEIRLGAPLEATVDVQPDTLNLKSKGKPLTAYIELPEGHDVSDIDVPTVYLTVDDSGHVPASISPTEVGDYDEDGNEDRMVKFGIQAVADLLQGLEEATITVAGELSDGTQFSGADTCAVKGGISQTEIEFFRQAAEANLKACTAERGFYDAFIVGSEIAQDILDTLEESIALCIDLLGMSVGQDLLNPVDALKTTLEDAWSYADNLPEDIDPLVYELHGHAWQIRFQLGRLDDEYEESLADFIQQELDAWTQAAGDPSALDKEELGSLLAAQSEILKLIEQNAKSLERAAAASNRPDAQGMAKKTRAHVSRQRKYISKVRASLKSL